MTDGIIELGTERAAAFGFTADLFDGYLWKQGRLITISFIESRQPGQGHFSALVKRCLDMGFAVGVPTPLGKIRAILMHLRFTPGLVEYPDGEVVELWLKMPAHAVLPEAQHAVAESLTTQQREGETHGLRIQP